MPYSAARLKQRSINSVPLLPVPGVASRSAPDPEISLNVSLQSFVGREDGVIGFGPASQRLKADLEGSHAVFCQIDTKSNTTLVHLREGKAAQVARLVKV